MTFVPYNQIGTAPGYEEGTPLGDALKGAGDFVCDLYEQFPGFMSGDFGTANPISRGIWDQLCKPSRGPAPVPTLPPPGGQCQCIVYEQDFEVFIRGATRIDTIPFVGPYGPPGWYPLDNGNLAYGFYHQNSTCTGWVVSNVIANILPSEVQDGQFKVTPQSIRRVDGQPDLCGSLPPVYPPTVPKPDDLERPIIINYGPDVDVSIPIIYVQPDIDVNVDVNARVRIPVTINMPDINISLDFNLGGVEINNYQPSGKPPVLPKPDPRDPKPLPPTGGLERDVKKIKDDLRDIERQLDDIQECACQEEGTKRSIQRAPATAEIVNVPPKTFTCTLEITEKPVNSKEEWGGGARNVVYAGWAWFTYEDGGLSPRMPIDADLKSFIPPRPNPVAFVYTYKVGYKGVARIHYFES